MHTNKGGQDKFSKAANQVFNLNEQKITLGD